MDGENKKRVKAFKNIAAMEAACAPRPELPKPETDEPTEAQSPGFIRLMRAVELAGGQAQPQNCGEGLIVEAARAHGLEPFELGAVVTLRSGGHLMTIVDPSCSSHYTTPIAVVWSANGVMQEEEIPRVCLRRASEAEIARALREHDDIPF